MDFQKKMAVQTMTSQRTSKNFCETFPYITLIANADTLVSGFMPYAKAPLYSY